MGQLGKIFNTVARYGSLFGAVFFTFICITAFDVRALNPDATLLDMAGHFYGNIAQQGLEKALPGAAIILGELLGFTTDFILPGAGIILSSMLSAFNANQLGGAATSTAMELAP